MMLTGGLMMLWAALLFVGLPVALVVLLVVLIARSSGRTADSGQGPDQASK